MAHHPFPFSSGIGETGKLRLALSSELKLPLSHMLALSLRLPRPCFSKWSLRVQEEEAKHTFQARRLFASYLLMFHTSHGAKPMFNPSLGGRAVLQDTLQHECGQG